MFRDEQQSRRIAVEAVAWVKVKSYAALFVKTEHGICDRSVRFLCCRMHELTCGLVDDEEIIVLVDDGERKPLGGDGADNRQLIGYNVACAQHGTRGDGGHAVHGECSAVFDAFPQSRRNPAHAHEIRLYRAFLRRRQCDDVLRHSLRVCSERRSARMMRKEMERMMAMTVASAMPRSVTVPMVRLAVDTPTPMTMEVRRRFIGLL